MGHRLRCPTNSLPTFSYTLRTGRLDVFIDRFPRLKLEYEELEGSPIYEHRLIAAVERSLKLSYCKCTSL